MSLQFGNQYEINDPWQPRAVVAAEVESRKVCCCGAGTWAVVIAIIGMFFSGLGLLQGIATLTITGYDYSHENEYPFDQMQNKTRENFKNFGAAEQIRKSPFVTIIAPLLGLAVAIILYIGTQRKKPLLLLIWLTITGIQIAFYIICAAVITIVLLIAKVDAYMIIIILILFLLISGLPVFCFWVVLIHRREMVQSLRAAQNHMELERIQRESGNFERVPVDYSYKL